MPVAIADALASGDRAIYGADMYLGRVIGTCVATVKYEGLQGARLLIVEAIDDDGTPVGAPHVAVDTTQAGRGETVFCVASREAALACDPSFVPVDAAIVGIVDELYVPDARPDARQPKARSPKAKAPKAKAPTAKAPKAKAPKAKAPKADV